MSPTTEQRDERHWLAALVKQTGVRFRVKDDAEGWPMIPGRLGNVEWAGDREHLAVYTTHMRMVSKLFVVPGVRRHQTGDAEARLVFPADPVILWAVCAVIRARVRRLGRPGDLAALAKARQNRVGK